MEIKEIALKDIKPYKNNPRNNAGAVDAVAQSLQEFGAKVPIILDKDNIIVAGHTRLKAAKKLKLKTFPCVYADDLTPDQVKAFRLVDNKTAELAQWDFTKLENELKNITLDMSDYGFTVPELQPETHDDNFAEEAVEIPAVVKAGEIWQLGKHRLMCGDATSLADVQKLTRGGANCIVLHGPAIRR